MKSFFENFFNTPWPTTVIAAWFWLWTGVALLVESAGHVLVFLSTFAVIYTVMALLFWRMR